MKRAKQEVKEMMERRGFKRIMRGYVSYLVVTRSDLSSHLNMDGQSFTDGERIVVGIDDWTFRLTDAEILLIVQALAIHECQHVNSSSFSLYKSFIMDSVAAFKTKHPQVPSTYVSAATKFIGNGTEDGRIEWISVNKRPGTAKPLTFLRGHWWNTQPMEGKSEYTDFLFAIVTQSTMGLMPKDWGIHYPADHRATELIEEIKPLIMQASRAINAKKHNEVCKEIFESIEPYIVKMAEEDNQDTNNKIEQPSYSQVDFSETEGDEEGDESFESTIHFNTDGEEEESEETEEGGSPFEINGKSQEEEEEGNNEGTPSKGQDEGVDKEGSDSGSEGKGEKGSESELEELTDEEKVQKKLEEASSALESADEQLQSEENRQKKEEEKDYANRGELSPDEMKEIMKSSHLKDENAIEIVHPGYLEKGYASFMPIEMRKESAKLRKEIQTIFENKKAYTQRNQKRGIVDPSSLWKVGMKETDVFLRKSISRETDFAAFFLCDGSYSMAGQKYKLSKKAIAIAEDALKDIVPLKIMQFSTGKNQNVLYHSVVKGFNENKKGNYTLSHYDKAGPYFANADGASIRIATAELLKRNEREKILFVFSDGVPSAYPALYGDRQSLITDGFKHGVLDTREAVREARKKGVFVVSIYFEINEKEREKNVDIFRFMYGNNAIICDAKEIGRHLTRTLKKILKSK